MTTSNAEVLEAKDTTAVANNASPLTRNGRPGKQELEEPVKSGVISSIDHLRLSLLTEPEPDWSPMAELNRSELHMLLKHLLDSGTHRLACPDVESSTSFVNNFGRFCSRYADHPLSAGVAGLAEDLNSAAPENFSVSLLIGLLGGESGDHFAFSHLPELLSGLDVDWSRYDALGHVACSLLAWPECNAEPERIGRLFRSLVLPADSSAAEEGFFATEDVIDVIVAVLEEEWDAVLAGHIAKGMLPRWHEERVQDILQTMVGRWMDAGTANVKQFELLDLSMTHNKAYQAGVIVDCLGMPESSALGFSVQFLQWFWLNFSEEDEPAENDPPLVCCMRGTWFAGRILQQLSVCHDPTYIPLGTRAWFGGCWRASLAIELACRLTAVEPGSTSDWRFDRRHHAYHVGAVLFQLRERWWTAELTSLISGLKRPSNFPEGTSPPSRIISEVLDGLNADWDVWLPRLQSLEKSFWVRHISASGITADDCIAAGQRPSDEALQDTPRTDDDEGDHGAKEVDGTTWANDAGHREKE